MTEGVAKRRWTRRASLTTARLLTVGLGVLCLLAGWELTVLTGGVGWALGAVLVSILLLVKVGPWVVGLLEEAGLFGRVTWDGTTLDAGRGAPVVELDRPFRTSIQHDEVDASYVLRLDIMGVSRSRQERTESRFYSMLVARIEQDAHRLVLAADAAGAERIRREDLRGLSYHRTPVGPAGGTVVRMRAADLVTLLRDLKEVPGGSLVAPPEATRGAGDPRRRLWPTWHTALGLVVLLGLGLGVAVWRMETAPPSVATSSSPQASVEVEPEEPVEVPPSPDPRAAALLGKRVAFAGDGGVTLYGMAEACEVRRRSEGEEGEDATAWRTLLRVRIHSLEDAQRRPLPLTTEVPWRDEGERVGSGSVVEVDLAETEVRVAETDD